MSTNENNAKLGQKWSREGHVTHFWNFGTPCNIVGTNESGNFKFGTYMEGSEYEGKKCKIRSKVIKWGSRDLLLGFWDPPNISGTNEARNFKFGTKMDCSEY